MAKSGKCIMRTAYAALVLAFIMTVFSGCAKKTEKQSDVAIEKISFRDIPGISISETSAIEALQKKYDSFVYGINPTTEAFIGKDGEINGYAVMFCGWLSEMFGIQFRPVYYQWGDLLRGLESGEVDFTGELMSTSAGRAGYFMSSPTINRTIKSYRIKGSMPVTEIIHSRLPRYAFLREAVVSADIDANTDYTFETVLVDSHQEAHQMLKSGEIDAFFGLDTGEGAFDVYGDVENEEFYPLIFRSSCLSTRQEELFPVISVLNKAMNARTLEYLTTLQNMGHQQYMENKLYTLLTEEEHLYIQNNPVIPVGADFSNYPVSFFDTHTNTWEGIYFEALNEIAKLTGLTFEIGNDHTMPLLDVIDRVEKGHTLIMPELFQIKEYEGRFLWSDIPTVTDHFVFVSRADFRNINVNDVFHLHVGLRKNTIYSEMFKKVFPAHRNFTEYDTQEGTWAALGNGDIDVIFCSRRRLLIFTNYYEASGYKLNLVFNHTFDSFFGYNRDAAVLKSIVDKALRVINIDNMTNQWIYKTYDYRNKLATAQRPWLIGLSVMIFLVLVLVSFFLIKSRSSGKQLETIVRQRTSELSFKTSQLEMVIDSIPDVLFCKDNELRYTQCNKHFEEFVGVGEAEVLGKTDAEGKWLSTDSTDRISGTELSVLNEKRIIKLEEYVSSPVTGKKSYFETVKAPLIQDGIIVGMMSIARDISERKAMEKEIAYQTSLLKTIIDSMPDGVFCKDVNLLYTLCNKYMADLFGKKPEDIIGKNDVNALGFTAEAAALANDADRKVISEHRQVIFEEWLMCSDGVERLFETVKVPLIMEGEVIGILGIGRDITKRKAMEDEVRAASRTKSDFLANMSHEIRTPLNVIIGLTALVLEDGRLDRHVTENLIKINNAGATLLSIVNDILDFSKIESGKLKISPVEYYMSSLLNDVITLVITRLGEKPITFSLNIADDMPAKLYGDDLRIKQILTNLLSNSVKYTHRGKIDLNVNCTREGDSVWMEISVSDTGIGIREDDVKKLFLDYFQVDAKANRNIEGTGLGLPITKRLVEMMDGEIHAESEYGKGTTFRLRIRQGFVEDTPIGADLADKLRSFRYIDDKRIVTKRLVRLNLSYARVLVVDDMQTNLDVAVGLLRKYKMQVDCVTNGHEAIDKINSGNPVYNAIFMDHMMPGMDGIETADAIRALGTEYARKLPIIALTANAIYGTEQMFFEHGFQAFISKPIDIIELDSVIKKWVRNEAQEKALGTEAFIAPDLSSEDESNVNIAIDIPGVDTEKGISLYGGDIKIYLALLRSYVSNAPGNLNKLRAVSKETLPEYVIAVHGLKGTSANIGAEAIRTAALHLENLSRAGDLEGVLMYNDRLINDTEIIVANVKTWLDQYDAVNAKPRLKTPDRKVLARLRQCCERYDMSGIDEAMSELESAVYEEGAELITWLKEKIDISEIDEAAARLAQYEEELNKDAQ